MALIRTSAHDDTQFVSKLCLTAQATANVIDPDLIDLNFLCLTEKNHLPLTGWRSRISYAAPEDDAFLALDEALNRLTSDSPLKGQLIELRFFAGMTAEESAETVSLPVQTVRRELRLAKAWLHRELA